MAPTATSYFGFQKSARRLNTEFRDLRFQDGTRSGRNLPVHRCKLRNNSVRWPGYIPYDLLQVHPSMLCDSSNLNLAVLVALAGFHRQTID